MTPKNANNGKMQNVSFASIDELLDFLPDDELKITQRLRKIVFDCAPLLTEKLSYNVPYYKMNKGLFFIWPASVLWGKKQTHTGVRFGFQQGHLLTDENNCLDRGGRKQVYWRDYADVKEIDADLLRTFIYEVITIDEQFKSTKRAQ